MKRPILWFLFCLSAGILLGFYDVSHAAAVSLLLGILLCVALYKWLKYPPIFLCVFAALAGAVLVQNSLRENVAPSEETQITGVVHTAAFTRAGWQRLVVDAEVEGESARMLVFLSPEYPVETGTRAIFTGEIAALRRAVNPGGFDEFLHQRTRGISARMYARSAEVLGTEFSIWLAASRARERLSAAFGVVLPHREAALMQSIILGDMTGLDDFIREQYRDVGIYHLLVVSGMHLTILMLAVTLALEKFLNKRVAGIIALAVMLFYTLLVGAGISIVRAFVMAGVYVVGRLLYRDTDPLASVSFAAIVLLMFQPLFLFDIGFQLSFGTVFGLIILPNALERSLGLAMFPPGKLRTFLTYNIAVFVAVSPITAFHFGRVSGYSILVNLVIMPTSTILVVLGMLVGLVGLVSVEAAAFLSGTLYYILRFYDGVSRFFLELPHAVWFLRSGELFVTIGVFAVVGAFVYLMHDFSGRNAARVRILAVTVVLLAASLVFSRLEAQTFGITTLDMSGSYSHVIRGSGQRFVLNGGGSGELLGANTGARILMPYLDRQGVRSAAGVFVTDTARHNIMGVIELAMENRAEAIYVPVGMNLEQGLGRRLREAARGNQIPIYRLRLGEGVAAGDLILTIAAENPMRLRVRYGEEIFVLP